MRSSPPANKKCPTSCLQRGRRSPVWGFVALVACYFALAFGALMLWGCR